MRIEQLDLIAYGHFTGVSLELGPGLHIVCGPNEAGKSTTLRAVRQLLYGFDASNSDDFVHPYSRQRIGAILRASDDRTLHVVRRKGNKGSLRDGADVDVIDETVMTELLAGVDEQTFRQRYGIDYEQLVRGGEEMTRGQGDLGQLLFASGAGLTDLTAVQTGLMKDAEALFKAKARNGESSPRINQTLAELSTQRERIKQASTSTAEWQEADTALSLARRRRAEIGQQLKSFDAELDRLKRWKTALPLIVELDDATRRLAQLESAPRLPDDFKDRRMKSVADLRHGEADVTATTNLLQKVTSELNSLNVSTAVLDRAESLRELVTEWGAYLKARRDRPALQASYDGAIVSLNRLVIGLGHDPAAIDLSILQVSKSDRTRLKKLGTERDVLRDKLERAEADLRQLERAIATAQQKRSEIACHSNSDELRRVVKLARDAGPLDRELVKAQSELNRLREEANAQLARLGVSNATLDDVAWMVLPSRETIRRFEIELEELVKETRSCHDRIVDVTRGLTQARQQLALLRKQQDVPTESELLQSREERELGWTLVRRAIDTLSDAMSTTSKSSTSSKRSLPGLGDDLESRAFVSKSPGARTLLDAYEQAVSAADQLADRLRREADRVAQRIQIEADCETKEQQLEESQRHERELTEKRMEFDVRWKSVWNQWRGALLPPGEMNGILLKRDELLTVIDSIRRQELLVSETEVLRQSLIAMMADVAGTENVTAHSLSSLLSEAESIVEQDSTARSQQDQLLQQITQMKGELGARQDALLSAQRQFNEWSEKWSDAMKLINHGPNAEPEDVNSYLEVLAEIHDLEREANGYRQRLSEIDADADQFTRRLRELANSILDDANSLTDDAIVDRLQAELKANERNAVQQRELIKQRAEVESRLVQAKRLCDDSRAELALLCRLANHPNCDDFDNLAAIEMQSMDRVKTEMEQQRILSDLRKLSVDGHANHLIDEVRSCDPDSLNSRLNEITSEIESLNKELDLQRDIEADKKSLLARMDGGSLAADAELEEQQLIARVENDALQYVRLRLAAAVLRHAIERYRKQNEGPVLKSAGDFFSTLTLGSFAGLRIEPSEKGEPRLMGVRSGGQDVVDVSGMSEGTCDQLYLALRLASLEQDHGARRQLPLIVDDILIQFDDARSSAALQVLSQVARQRQVIFFTHHTHLIALARKSLSSDAFSTHQFGRTHV